MSNKKRNQLIGFITLVLLALIIAPYIMTDKQQSVESTISLLPLRDIKAPIDEINEFNNFNVNHSGINNSDINDNLDVNDIGQDRESTQSSDVNSGLKPIQGNKQDTSVSSFPQSDKNYTIQLVALKNRQKIEELVALLRLNNYEAYTVPQDPKEGQIIRLLVGNYPTKEQADTVIIDLEHLTKLKGFVTTK